MSLRNKNKYNPKYNPTPLERLAQSKKAKRVKEPETNLGWWAKYSDALYFPANFPTDLVKFYHTPPKARRTGYSWVDLGEEESATIEPPKDKNEPIDLGDWSVRGYGSGNSRDYGDSALDTE